MNVKEGEGRHDYKTTYYLGCTILKVKINISAWTSVGFWGIQARAQTVHRVDDLQAGSYVHY